MSGLTATACFKVAQLEDNCSRNHSFLGSAVKISQKTPPKAKHPPSTVKSNKKQQKVTENHQFTFQSRDLYFLI
jgi:hypothetical protein